MRGRPVEEVGQLSTMSLSVVVVDAGTRLFVSPLYKSSPLPSPTHCMPFRVLILDTAVSSLSP